MSLFFILLTFYYACIYDLSLFWIISVAESLQASPAHGYKWSQFNKISFSHKPPPMERQYLRFTFKVPFLPERSVCILSTSFHPSGHLRYPRLLTTLGFLSMLALPGLHCRPGATLPSSPPNFSWTVTVAVSSTVTQALGRMAAEAASATSAQQRSSFAASTSVIPAVGDGIVFSTLPRGWDKDSLL